MMYRIKQSLIDQFIKTGRRPRHFLDHPSDMDMFLTGIRFSGRETGLNDNFIIVNEHQRFEGISVNGYLLHKDEVVELVDGIDNRRIDDV
jgi:hypothetical protein